MSLSEVVLYGYFVQCLRVMSGESELLIEGPFGHGFDFYKTSDFTEVGNLVGEVLQLVELPYERCRVDDGLIYDGYYSGKPVSARRMRRIIDALERFSLIESDTGHWRGPGRRGRESRMRSTPSLLELFQQYGVKLHMVDQSARKPLIQLKDENKEPMALPDDAESKRLIDRFTANLNEINTAFAQTFIGLHITNRELCSIAEHMSNREWPSYLDFSRKRVHRIFNNGSFDQGGRFFGAWWQNVPSEYRYFIHISHDGETHSPTREIDYSSMHPAIAYAQVGLALDSDPYEIPAVTECANEYQRQEIRNAAKLALNVALNASSISSARRAIVNELVKQRDRLEIRTGEVYVPDGCPEVPELLSDLLSLNEPIAEFIATGAGREFMRRESDIAERVMLRMLREKGAVVLPVHDSFLVHSDYERQLERTMLEEFEEETGQECALKFEWIDYDGQWPGDLNPFLTDKIVGELSTGMDVSQFEAEIFNVMWNEWRAFS